jgi:hypothetical protein
MDICSTNVGEFSSYIVYQYYIAYSGMETGRVTLSVHQSTSVSQTNGILRHECRRISIIHCMLVTTMCHQWKSVARLLQNFHYSIILVTRMSHQWTSAAQMLENFHHTLFISDYNVTPSKICGTIVAEFSLFYYISD